MERHKANGNNSNISESNINEEESEISDSQSDSSDNDSLDIEMELSKDDKRPLYQQLGFSNYKDKNLHVEYNKRRRIARRALMKQPNAITISTKWFSLKTRALRQVQIDKVQTALSQYGKKLAMRRIPGAIKLKFYVQLCDSMSCWHQFDGSGPNILDNEDS
ncbi:hypothetical protein RUND412_007590 [Rhizina undulata]